MLWIFWDGIEKKHYNKIKIIFEESLQKILPPKFEIRIFPINLYIQIDNHDDKDNLHIIKIIKAFALDKLFDRIYSIFKTNIIDLREVNKIKISEELYNWQNNKNNLLLLFFMKKLFQKNILKYLIYNIK